MAEKLVTCGDSAIIPDARMSGERFDYSNERQRHEKFVGRAGLLARLDQLLVDSDTDRWVVVTGGPGMGKSALLAAWLARRAAAGAAVPHHFIRRGEYDWDDPAKLVGSLVAQLEERFPDVREPDANVRMHPASRLARTLSRVAERELGARRERLVVLIDGLDEYDPPVGAAAGDPLSAFLPHALPRGVSLLCASRPRHPYVSSLEARDGELVRIDLDDPSNAIDNDATVRALWEWAAGPLGLDAHFIDEAVARAGGNVQHAVQLRKHLAVLPARQRRVEDIPRGLAALIEKSWERIAVDAVVVDGLGILCAAREALTLDELGAVAAWAGDAPRRAFLRNAKELLVETERPGGQPEYRLHHSSIRAHIGRTVGDVALRGHNGALARRLATWPAPEQAVARRYALRHALVHRAEAGDWADAWRLAANMSFLEAKCRELGVHETEADVARVAERCRASGNPAIGRRFSDLAWALVRESHWLRGAPEAIAALVWNRLRRSGWSANDIDGQLQVPAEATFLRVRHTATRESPALVRDLIGHSGNVNACAMTADGRRVVSASADRTLRVWDLESGRVLAHLEGHTDRVTACAVTANGRRVISASWDETLKVWDLETGRVLTTLNGHADWVNACAVTADGRHVISASDDQTLKVWDLATGQVLATLRGHAGRVNACAVTADGRRVISASADRTLKVWDLESGRELATLEGHKSSVNACAVAADGRRVVSASEDRTLKIWDLDSGRVCATLGGHADGVNACMVTAGGRRVVSASEDRTLKVWDLESGRMLATLEGHADGVSACTVAPDGRHVVSASWDETLKVWDLESGRALVALEGHADVVNACAVTADGRRAVSASEDRTLKVWDPESGRTLATLEGHAGGVTGCAVTADGRRVVSASDDRTLKVWDLGSGRALAILEGHASGVNACAVTANSRRAVSASEDRTLKVWDLEGACELATLKGHTDWVNGCAVTADGQRAVSASDDRTLKVWDLALPTLRVASTGWEYKLKWERNRGRARATLKGHTDGVSACAVTANGRRAVSASEDRTLKVWDLETGHELATLRGHSGVVTACAITADGKHVVSASDDRTLRVWDLDTRACVFIHRGDAVYTAVAAAANIIAAGDVTGGIWFLDWPPSKHHARPPGVSGGGQPGSDLAQDSAPLQQRMRKHTILFLAANPIGTDRLALDQEARAIQVELERSGHRDQFELVTRWAPQPLDLLRELRRLRPTVVHFSGHGSRGGPGESRRDEAPRRDVVGEPGPLDGEHLHGLFFQGPDGRAQLVSTAALEETFGAAGSSVKLVVLNACYSEVQAEAILAHVDCVVGMSGSIRDDAARNFAIGFYGGLAERESVAAAYKQGRAAISLEGLRDGDLPQLRVRDGVDANQLVLAEGDR